MVEARTNKDGGRMLFRFSSYNNGVSSARAYNNDNTLASIAFSGAPIGSYSYSWDANKNKTAETITGAMSGYSFTTGTTGYDDEDRLTRFTRGTLSQSWNLTSVGDWASFTSSGVGFQPAIGPRTHRPTHELTSVGGAPLTHDTKGNVTSKPSSLNPADTSSLAWDFDNRLDAIDVDGDTNVDVTFQYDALGRRVRKNDIVYVLSGQQVVAEYAAGTAATTPTEKYVYASYIDEPVLKDGTGGLQYYHRNQQYSVIALTNTAGTITERYAYDAYGNLTVLDASGSPFTLPNSNFNNGYSYTGRRFDAETGDYYYRTRQYAPKLGRFLSRDSVGYRAGYLLYNYTGGNPINHTDPDGRWAVHVATCGGCGACMGPAIYYCGSDPECWRLTWELMPTWHKWACGAACGGCALILGRAVVVAGPVIIRKTLPGIGREARRKCKKNVRKIGKCTALWNEYKYASKQADGCKTATNCDDLKNKCLWAAAEVAGRTNYLHRKCDSILPKNLSGRGRTPNQILDGHLIEARNKRQRAISCCARMTLVCGANAIPTPSIPTGIPTTPPVW